MIKIDKLQVFNFMAAIRGARNPMNSHHKMDSVEGDGKFILGDNDKDLAIRLIKAGSDHRKFIRQIFVSVDITAPLYWWKEFDTYKVSTVANSESTMHKIHAKPFTMDLFSYDKVHTKRSLALAELTVERLNELREVYLKTKDKDIWYEMIQLLPSSWNQTRTCTFNYETLLNMYNARRYHKLDEWRIFVEQLVVECPYARLLLVESFYDKEV